MVNDQFLPKVGGVEMHMYYLSQELIKKGHTVIIITQSQKDKQGVRFLSNGIKVYYLHNSLMQKSKVGTT
jgi:phosphatidylinositol N-acetylglucosaminyltransferase subunit A